jgi:NADH-quinone oxidoreductase subunit L
MVFLTLVPAGGAPGQPHGAGAAQAGGGAGERAMRATVLGLAALTLVLGYLGPFFGARLSPGEPERGPFEIGGGALVALALVAAGIALAWYEFGRRGATRLGFAERVPALARFFGDNWYLDRLYRATVIRWATALSRAAHWNDERIVNGATDGLANGTVGGGRILSLVQNGYVQAYLAVVVTLIAVLAAVLTRLGGGR